MGWSCSWIAVEGVGKDELLERLELVVTGAGVEPGSRGAPMSVSQRQNGWTVLFSEDFDWASPDRIRAMSKHGLVVGCQFEDKVDMTSVASAAEGGIELWRVFHMNDPEHRLDISGRPPAELASIREKALREQDGDEDVDFLYEIPMELAAIVCGYRAEDDTSLFEAVRPAAQVPARAPAKTSFLDKLLAPLKARRD